MTFSDKIKSVHPLNMINYFKGLTKSEAITNLNKSGYYTFTVMHFHEKYNMDLADMEKEFPEYFI